MSPRLPDFLEPLRLARQGVELNGQVPLARMPRLLAALAGDEGRAEVSLRFGTDEAGIVTLRGRISVELPMICQRCLQPMTQPVQVDVALAPVADDGRAAELPDEYEPLVVGEGRLSTAELVEDELLLALPIVPMHEPSECPASQWLDSQAPAPEQEEQDERPNPFAALSALKDRKPSD
jgi:uncharacterized protein